MIKDITPVTASFGTEGVLNTVFTLSFLFARVRHTSGQPVSFWLAKICYIEISPNWMKSPSFSSEDEDSLLQ